MTALEGRPFPGPSRPGRPLAPHPLDGQRAREAEADPSPRFGDGSSADYPIRTGKAWYYVASASLVFALLQGFGSYVELIFLKPKIYGLLQFVMLATIIVLMPRDGLRRVFLPIPTVAYMGWWIASYFWAHFRQGFLTSNLIQWAGIAVVVLVGGALRVRDVIRCILISGYISAGLVVVALLVQPSDAYSAAGATGAAGLRGGFIHKSGLASCLLLAMSATLCFETRRWIRVSFTAVVGVMVVLSGSSSGLATMGVLLIANWVLAHWAEFKEIIGRGLTSLTVFVAVSTVIGVGALLGVITSLLGKDLTFTGRTGIWKGVVAAIKVYPVQGWGGYDPWPLRSREPVASINRPLQFLAFTAHNGVLEILLRLGIIGLVLYLWQYATTIMTGSKLLHTAPRLGRFVLMLTIVVFFFAISEIITVFGVWLALVCLFGAPTLAERLRLDE